MVAILIVIVAAAPECAVAFDTGFKTGACFANISGDIPGLGSDFTIRNGFSGGFFFDFKLGEKFSIQPEAIYMQKGAWIRDIPFQFYTPEGVLEGIMDFEFRIWYFEFPILLKYTMRTDSFLRPFLYAGPAASYTQRAVVQVSQNLGPYSWGARDDISGELKKWDFGTTFGGGMHFAFGSSFSVFLEGRYNLGLINLSKTDDETTIKNRAITALIGLNVKFSE
jgi:opacity protein-like surface antigen